MDTRAPLLPIYLHGEREMDRMEPLVGDDRARRRHVNNDAGPD